ncbi:bis(5'-nucleosyl)-tetraphosphatase (symmetrical) YqeK [uncultured Limosilactobacillus sp.]|uniref:bis(5'-nucleosyl)-tetraphosphatase (symmetrical) YqeK n=1 Tax=uncultured Limosilactobacillus sp. TaxID=2837629 RepID=UPI0025EB1F74|nr:bis(5'-nucleosyl)-tetraphosphatase (symmetrical) YqeK [uncultured Limosilactobacillus sp.]
MMTTINYQQHLLPLSRQQLVDKLAEALTEDRFHHVLRVEQTAIKLAKQYGVDLEKASIAGLCHDYAKQRPDEDFLREIKEDGLDPDLLNWNNAIWHGIVGAEMVKHELDVWDEDILNAIRHHTTGAPVMSPLEQIIYMADYIEPGRSFAEVVKARELTAKSLTLGVAYQTEQTLAYLVERDLPVYPATILTYNAWVPQNKGEL